jgi:hypothetical protein
MAQSQHSQQSSSSSLLCLSRLDRRRLRSQQYAQEEALAGYTLEEAEQEFAVYSHLAQTPDLTWKIKEYRRLCQYKNTANEEEEEDVNGNGNYDGNTTRNATAMSSQVSSSSSSMVPKKGW